MKQFILFILFPISCFGQQIFKDSVEINFIIQHCHLESKEKANELLAKYREAQRDNMFDFTLKTYFEILQYPNCKEYDEFLESLWIYNKVISGNYFAEKFLNKKDTYHKLLLGFNSPQDFSFANNHPSELTLDQGINKQLWFEILSYIKTVSENDFKVSVQKNIEQLSSHDLLNFLAVIQENFDLNVFENDLIMKMKKVKYPFDMDFLMRKLIQNEQNHAIIEQILNEKIIIWDTGNWSKKYWEFIDENNLNIDLFPFYSLNENGQKVYDIEKFIAYYESRREIGRFPMISVNHELILYYNKKNSSLKEYLETLNIQNIEVKKSEDAIKLYGSRGKDGFLEIMTY